MRLAQPTWHTPALLARALLALVALAPAARAQIIPPIEPGTPMVSARLIDKQLELRDLDTNTPLIVTRGMQITTPLDPLVKVDLKLQQQPSGADIIVTYTNTSDVPSPQGMLNLGIITLGPELSYLDMRYQCDFVNTNVAEYVGKAWGYPDFAYSPAWVLVSPTYAMGISLQYPVLEYKHDLKLSLDNPRGIYLNGEGGRGWSVHFGLSGTGSEAWQTVHRQASLPPGESRTYVMSIRVTRTPSEWLRTLTPYRDYFRATYGGVKYTRNTTPVRGLGVGDSSLCSDSNPYGYATEFRPDLYGWSKLTTYVKNYVSGWKSILLWMPSGAYRYHKSGNFPPQMCTPWLETPLLSTAFDPSSGLPSLVKPDRELGIWWGRSCQVSPGGWDPPYLEEFDASRGDHVQGKIKELDLAVKAGVRLVALDTFDTTFMPLWQMYSWVEFMRLRHPDVRFVMEPRPCDIMHSIAPTFISGWNDDFPPKTQEDLYLVKHPLHLADFLLPGHETWVGYRYTEWQQYYGITPDANRVISDMQRFAALGFVPCMLVPPNIPENTVIDVARTWETTVPPDLQLPDTPEPFGPVRAGSSKVALGTSSAPRPGINSGPEVRGFVPTRPKGTEPVAAPLAAPVTGGPAPDAGAPVDLSRKVVVRRSAQRPVPARRAGTPEPAPEDPASTVRTFVGTGADRPTLVLPATPAPAPPPRKP